MQALDIGVTSLVLLAPVTLALFTPRLGRFGSTLLAFIALLCIAAVVLFDFGAISRKVRMASRILKTAVAAYKADPAFTIQDLNKECDAAAALMSEIGRKRLRWAAGEKATSRQSHNRKSEK